MKTSSNIQFSVIIPSYNSENVVEESVERICKIFEEKKITCEIILVNDGSTDNTLKIIQSIEKRKSHVKVITYPKNMGKGFAVRNGINNSVGEWVMYTDSDLDISFDFFDDYLQHIKKYDIIVVSKYHHLSKVSVPKSRKILSKLFTMTMHSIIGLNIADTQVGFKIGRGDLMRKIFAITKINGFAFDVEFLCISTLLSSSIIERPVKMNPCDKYTYSQLTRLSLKMLYQLFKILFNFKITHYYQKKLS